ncbi:MAG TPA: hypothetical protein VGN96_01015 [Roseococcus sp.]|jgi:hypothetical protein|nr:hypothetical protein [Roseococcus sp.]
MGLFFTILLLLIVIGLFRMLPGLFTLLLALMGLAVLVAIPMVFMNHPWTMLLVVLCAAFIAIPGIMGPRLLARALMDRRAERAAARFRAGEDSLRCVVGDTLRRGGERFEGLRGQFLWVPTASLAYPRKLEATASVLIHVALLALVLFATQEPRRDFLSAVAAAQDQGLYPLSALATFVLLLAGAHWLDRRLHPPEAAEDGVHERFHRVVNRHVPLDAANSAENRRLLSELLDLGPSINLFGDRLGNTFLDHVAGRVAATVREGGHTAALGEALTDLLRRAVADLNRAGVAMRRILGLRPELDYLHQHRPDLTARGYEMRRFLDGLEDWDSLCEAVFLTSGPEAIAAGRDRAERIAAELAAYLAERRGQVPPGGGAASGRTEHGRSMTRAEALSLLGLTEGARREDILAAHRRLIKAVHPDVGGTTGLAARINEARDLLLA